MSDIDGILAFVLLGLLPIEVAYCMLAPPLLSHGQCSLCEAASTSTPLVTAIAASTFGFGELTSCDCTRCCALKRLTRCLRG
ncbi:hypothetical protein PF008_g19139 [Phytophthora fragariae]|uniref:Secreted peptide n=1 Tax=Phytophthora fragariae TaxID=53985 RepID=A0A6G0R4C9_9STRA|nr:hypothetical protein PF008_g19139 [Phytophthora fragariae]